MRSYVDAILTAVMWFPFVAFLFTLPFMVVQYRKYGAVLMLRTVIVYSFILYLMCADFLTILPLPPIEKVAQLKSEYLQLMPFTDVVNWIQKSGAVLNQPATWIRLIWNRDLFVMVANIVMLIPMGIYLRYYFGCSWKQTFFISLGTSLIFELTQLSALFGIYPRPYRLCETDDLITNTLGGMIGFWLAKPLMKRLPTHEHLNAVAYHKGQHVSVTRRVTAALVDWMLIGFVMAILVFATPMLAWLFEGKVATTLLRLAMLYVTVVFLYFILGEWLQGGLTIGKRLTHLRLIDDRGGQGRPKLWQCMIRYALLYYGFVPLPVVALILWIASYNNEHINYLIFGASILLLLLYMIVVVMVVIRVLTKSNQLPHGELSKTRNISTLIVTTDMLEVVGDKPSDDPKVCGDDASEAPEADETLLNA